MRWSASRCRRSARAPGSSPPTRWPWSPKFWALRRRALGGKALAGVCADAPAPDGDVIKPVAKAISPTGGVVVIKGTLAPDGARIKVAGLKSLLHEGPARVFESEEECMAVIRARA